MTSDFQSHLACIERSYAEAPSAPTNASVGWAGPEGAKLAWHPPQQLAESVTGYTVQIR